MIRYAFRNLVHRIGPTSAIIATLGLGLGATAAISSVMRAVLLAPLPYREPSALVLLEARLETLGDQLIPIPRAEFLDYRAQLTAFEAIGGFEGSEVTLTGGGLSEPLRFPAAHISANVFPLLGLAPLHGRHFEAADERPNAPPVAILSHALWTTVFRGESAALERTVMIDSIPHRVIGVMPPSVEFPAAGTPWAEPAAIWTPLVLPEAIADRGANFTVGVIARLRRGMALAHATADVDRVAARMRAAHTPFYERIRIRPALTPLATRISGTSARLVWLLAGAALVLMLIACANASNLLLAQSVRERGERAVRLALGARPIDLIGQTTVEHLLLGGAGALCGIGIAYLALRVTIRFAPAEIPRLANARIDLDVAGVTAIVALVVAVIAGAAPACSARRATLSSLLENAGRQLPARQRTRRVLVIAQTAGALVLLLASALLLNSFVRILHVRPGFDPDDLLTMRLALPEARYADAAALGAKLHDIADRIASLPGVEAAALASAVPIDSTSTIALSVEGGDGKAPHFVTQAAISPAYFKTMAIPLRRGRDFNTSDAAGAPGAIIISEALARRLWRGDDPLGKRAQWGTLRSDRPWLTVVGVVGDVHATSLTQAADPMVYMPIAQAPPLYAPVALVRSRRAAEELRVAVRETVARLDGDIPIYGSRTMREVMRASLAQRSFLLLVITLFASVSVTLSMLGLFGLLAFVVSLRGREIGVRLAVGATPGRVLRQVVREGLILAAAGAALGICAATIVTRPLAALLYDVGPLDPLTYAAATGLLLLTAAAAAVAPARRAARTDPAVTLRRE